jgi:hypothetical protein
MKAHSLQVISPGVQQYPTISNIVSPIQLVEAAPGAVGTLMTEADPIPLIAPGPVLNYWHWDGTNILFTGATTTREVLAFYWRSLPLPQSGTDTLQIIDGEMWLAPRTAAIAAAAVGEETTSATAAANAQATMEQVILANRGRSPQAQGISVRP